jgi:hypothetical protein
MDNTMLNHVLPSIFPKLDAFIEAACTQGGVQGMIRSWAVQGNAVMYSMKNNRFVIRKTNGLNASNHYVPVGMTVRFAWLGTFYTPEKPSWVLPLGGVEILEGRTNLMGYTSLASSVWLHSTRI